MNTHRDMLAAIFRKPGQPLEIASRAIPDPGPQQVLLKVGRCGICGSDLHMTEPESARVAPDTVIGHEISGEVVAIGQDVTRIKVGDRVAALPISGCGACESCLAGEPGWCADGMKFLAGGFAQYALAGEHSCLILPSGLSLADGALVEPLAVALHGVRMAPNLRGLTVLVMGAGPIGLAVVYWARRLGAASITVVEGNSTRVEMAMAMGASASRLPDPERGSSAWREAPPPDVVFECVGRPGLLATAVSAVRARGTIISLGFCMVAEPIVTSAAAVREITMKFPILYSLGEYQTTIDALDAGHIEPRAMITDTISLAALPITFEAMRQPSESCKVMIDPWM